MKPVLELDYLAMILNDYADMDEIQRLNLIRALLEDLDVTDRTAVVSNLSIQLFRPIEWDHKEIKKEVEGDD